MKSLAVMSAVAVVSLASLSQSFAMDATTGAMMKDDSAMMHDTMMQNDAMKKDTMSTDAMMKSDTMMKSDAMMTTTMTTKMTVFSVAKSKGYNWMKDRNALAKLAGITNYRGTAAQNIKIRTYLLKGAGADAMMKNDSMMKGDTMSH